MRLLALSAALANLAAAPPPDPLGALAAANGHAAAVHFRATATRTVEGRTIVTTFDQLGTEQLLERCVAGVCGGTWFDGARLWTFGLNEVALPEPAGALTRAQRTVAAIVSYAFAEPAFAAAGGTVAAAGPDRWRVRAPEGTELIAIADPARQAIARIDTTDGRTVAVYGRESSVDGARFALDRDDPSGAGELDAVSATAGPLGPPAGSLPAFSGEPSVPLAPDTIPIVPCTVGGRRARCLLDTGTTPSAITLPLAEALGLEPHGEIEISGFTRVATGFVETGPFRLGPATFAGARFAVVPASNALPFDAVIGSDLLGRVRLVLDRRRGIASISPPGSSLAAGAVPIAFRAGAPTVVARLGSTPYPALLDTGDDSAISLGYALYRIGPQWPVAGRGEVVGLGGASDAFTVEIPDTGVGPLGLGTTRALVRRTQPEVHVGIGLWNRYLIDLDEQAERIRFDSR